MIYLQKTWVRIVVSLLTGGIVTEMVNINSADPNHTSSSDRGSFYTLILATIIYFILTAVVKKNEKNMFKK